MRKSVHYQPTCLPAVYHLVRMSKPKRPWHFTCAKTVERMIMKFAVADRHDCFQQMRFTPTREWSNIILLYVCVNIQKEWMVRFTLAFSSLLVAFLYSRLRYYVMLAVLNVAKFEPAVRTKDGGVSRDFFLQRCCCRENKASRTVTRFVGVAWDREWKNRYTSWWKHCWLVLFHRFHSWFLTCYKVYVWRKCATNNCR